MTLATPRQVLWARLPFSDLVKHESESLPVEAHAAGGRNEEHVVQVERSPGREDGFDFAEEGLDVAQPPEAAPRESKTQKKHDIDGVPIKTDKHTHTRTHAHTHTHTHTRTHAHARGRKTIIRSMHTPRNKTAHTTTPDSSQGDNLARLLTSSRAQVWNRPRLRWPWLPRPSASRRDGPRPRGALGRPRAPGH